MENEADKGERLSFTVNVKAEVRTITIKGEEYVHIDDHKKINENGSRERRRVVAEVRARKARSYRRA
jgi:hypothetical protein